MNEIDLIDILNKVKEDPDVKAKIESLKSIFKTLGYGEDWANRIIRRADRITIRFAAKYYGHIKDPELLKKSLKADYLAEIDRGKKWFYRWIEGLGGTEYEKLKQLREALGV